MRNLLIILALIPTVMVGCKRGHSKNPVAAVSEAAKDKDLQKTWQSDCSLKPIDAVMSGLFSGGQASVKSMRVQYKILGNNVTRSTVVYSQTECVQEAWTFEETGSFKIDDKQKTNDGGKFIDLDMRKLSLTVRDQIGATAANALKLCGKSDWAVSSKPEPLTKNLKDASCYGADVPRKILNVYRIDGNVLHLGTETAGQARPSTVNFGLKFTSK